jgi:hypothetical protein
LAASIIDADSFDEVPDTAASTALLRRDAAEPMNQFEVSPEMEQIKSNSDYQSRLSKVNRFDGTYHAPDGHREFPDGTIVRGVNNYAARQRSAPKKGKFNKHSGVYHNQEGHRVSDRGILASAHN